MMNKTCTKCRRSLDPNHFYVCRKWNWSVVLQSWCKDCKREQCKLTRRAARAVGEDGRKYRTWRTPYGENAPRAKLTNDDVFLIKQMNDIKPRELAEKFDVSPQLIRAIRRGDYWSHI